MARNVANEQPSKPKKRLTPKQKREEVARKAEEEAKAKREKIRKMNEAEAARPKKGIIPPAGRIHKRSPGPPIKPPYPEFPANPTARQKEKHQHDCEKIDERHAAKVEAYPQEKAKRLELDQNEAKRKEAEQLAEGLRKAQEKAERVRLDQEEARRKKEEDDRKLAEGMRKAQVAKSKIMAGALKNPSKPEQLPKPISPKRPPPSGATGEPPLKKPANGKKATQQTEKEKPDGPSRRTRSQTRETSRPRTGPNAGSTLATIPEDSPHNIGPTNVKPTVHVNGASTKNGEGIKDTITEKPTDTILRSESDKMLRALKHEQQVNLETYWSNIERLVENVQGADDRAFRHVPVPGDGNCMWTALGNAFEQRRDPDDDAGTRAKDRAKDMWNSVMNTQKTSRAVIQRQELYKRIGEAVGGDTTVEQQLNTPKVWADMELIQLFADHADAQVIVFKAHFVGEARPPNVALEAVPCFRYENTRGHPTSQQIYLVYWARHLHFTYLLPIKMKEEIDEDFEYFLHLDPEKYGARTPAAGVLDPGADNPLPAKLFRNEIGAGQHGSVEPDGNEPEDALEHEWAKIEVLAMDKTHRKGKGRARPRQSREG